MVSSQFNTNWKTFKVFSFKIKLDRSCSRSISHDNVICSLIDIELNSRYHLDFTVNMNKMVSVLSMLKLFFIFSTYCSAYVLPCKGNVSEFYTRMTNMKKSEN